MHVIVPFQPPYAAQGHREVLFFRLITFGKTIGDLQGKLPLQPAVTAPLSKMGLFLAQLEAVGSLRYGVIATEFPPASFPNLHRD